MLKWTQLWGSYITCACSLSLTAYGMECLLLQVSSQTHKQVLVRKAMYARYSQIKVLRTHVYSENYFYILHTTVNVHLKFNAGV